MVNAPKRSFWAGMVLVVLVLAACSGRRPQTAQAPMDTAKHYRFCLGPNEEKMTLVVKESKGSRTGFDTIEADVNRDGQTSPQEVFRPARVNDRWTRWQIPCKASFGSLSEAPYELHILLSQGPEDVKDATITGHGFTCRLDLAEAGTNWSYMLDGNSATQRSEKIEGRNLWTPSLSIYSFGLPVKLEMKADTSNKTLTVSATLKDKYGTGMGRLTVNGKDVYPHLKIAAPSGAVIADADLQPG